MKELMFIHVCTGTLCVTLFLEKKMNKITLGFALIALVAMILSGCSNTPQTTESTESVDSVDSNLVKSYMLKACSQATIAEFGEEFLHSDDAIVICFNTLNEYFNDQQSCWPGDKKTVVSGDYSAGYYVSLQIAEEWAEEIDFSSAYPDGEIHQYYRVENAVSSILDALKAVRLEMAREGILLSP